jgi:hypothetical protein
MRKTARKLPHPGPLMSQKVKFFSEQQEAISDGDCRASEEETAKHKPRYLQV